MEVNLYHIKYILVILLFSGCSIYQRNKVIEKEKLYLLSELEVKDEKLKSLLRDAERRSSLCIDKHTRREELVGQLALFRRRDSLIVKINYSADVLLDSKYDSKRELWSDEVLVGANSIVVLDSIELVYNDINGFKSLFKNTGKVREYSKKFRETTGGEIIEEIFPNFYYSYILTGENIIIDFISDCVEK